MFHHGQVAKEGEEEDGHKPRRHVTAIEAVEEEFTEIHSCGGLSIIAIVDYLMAIG